MHRQHFCSKIDQTTKSMDLENIFHIKKETLVSKSKILLNYLFMRERYILYTHLSEKKILDRISSILQEKYFHRIIKNQFQMYRKGSYRGEAMGSSSIAIPYLQGTIFPEAKISFISIIAKPHPMFTFITSLFYLIVITLIISDTFGILNATSKISPMILFLPIVWHLNHLIYFKNESRIIKTFLMQVLEAKDS
ncbi:hypothetical protein [Leptospira jelokensis]|uniref:hypothetical protein n=1 Tax=Leptospira jelokensis TaxID=2484931 RepID=UPI0010915DEB|nr:hypothetical protein [Leptospira jelokensis]TGL99635.1 hypothetical protein EHQ79_17810 [Leptospira jelokensis]